MEGEIKNEGCGNFPEAMKLLTYQRKQMTRAQNLSLFVSVLIIFSTLFHGSVISHWILKVLFINTTNLKSKSYELKYNYS